MKKKIKRTPEKQFKDWLEFREIFETERWKELSVDERDVLLEHYWQEFSNFPESLKKN